MNRRAYLAALAALSALRVHSPRAPEQRDAKPGQGGRTVDTSPGVVTATLPVTDTAATKRMRVRWTVDGEARLVRHPGGAA